MFKLQLNKTSFKILRILKVVKDLEILRTNQDFNLLSIFLLNYYQTITSPPQEGVEDRAT